MDEVLAAFRKELIAWAPEIMGALVATILGGFAWLQARMSWVRSEMAASAARQAVEQHGDHDLAVQAAADELHRIPEKLRPRDVADAAKNEVAWARMVKRASQAPTPIRADDAPSDPGAPGI